MSLWQELRRTCEVIADLTGEMLGSVDRRSLSFFENLSDTAASFGVSRDTHKQKLNALIEKIADDNGVLKEEFVGADIKINGVPCKLKMDGNFICIEGVKENEWGESSDRDGSYQYNSGIKEFKILLEASKKNGVLIEAWFEQRYKYDGSKFNTIVDYSLFAYTDSFNVTGARNIHAPFELNRHGNSHAYPQTVEAKDMKTLPLSHYEFLCRGLRELSRSVDRLVPIET